MLQPSFLANGDQKTEGLDGTLLIDADTAACSEQLHVQADNVRLFPEAGDRWWPCTDPIGAVQACLIPDAL